MFGERKTHSLCKFGIVHVWWSTAINRKRQQLGCLHTFKKNSFLFRWLRKFPSSSDDHECLSLSKTGIKKEQWTRLSTTNSFRGNFLPIRIILRRCMCILVLSQYIWWQTLRTPPLIITFIRSVGTPVARYIASLNAVGDKLVLSSRSYTFPACLIWTGSDIVVVTSGRRTKQRLSDASRSRACVW